MNTLVIPKYAKLQEAMDCIISNKVRTIFLQNEKSQIIGCLAEGDVLRAVLGGAHRNSTVSVFMNTNFIYFTEPLEDVELVRWFLKTGLLVLPILNSQRHLVKFQFPLEVIMKMVTDVK